MSLLQVLGIKTDLIRPGDDLVESLEKAMAKSGLAFQDGDILVVSESTVATAEGRVVDLDDVTPGDLAQTLAAKYGKDPREMELILRESDEIVGGIPGVVLTLNKGFLYPNAGIDNSNAPPGHVVLFPANAERVCAARIRERHVRRARRSESSSVTAELIPCGWGVWVWHWHARAWRRWRMLEARRTSSAGN